MHIETLVEDVNHLVLTKNTVTKHEAFNSMLEAVKHAVESLVKEAPAKRKNSLRPSNYGKPCKRQLWYSINENDVDKEPVAENYIKFAMGHIYEAVMLYLAQESGHSVTQQQKEIKDEETGIIGHIDALIDGDLVDCKSVSPYGYKKYQDGSYKQRDDFGYIPQLAWYKQQLGLDRAFLWCIDKSSCAHTLVPVDNSFMPSSKWYMKEVIKLVKHPEAPERQYEDVEDGKSGNRAVPNDCSYCDFVKKCWKPRAFKYANGIKYLTEVNRLPKVEEIAL